MSGTVNTSIQGHMENFQIQSDMVHDQEIEIVQQMIADYERQLRLKDQPPAHAHTQEALQLQEYYQQSL